MALTKITKPDLLSLGESTKSTQLPVFTTSNRPTTTTTGQVIFNSTTETVEFFDGTDWYKVDKEGEDGLTSASAFTSYDNAVASGQANGVYYFNDGTRTRQYYLDIDGTENGTGTGGWSRIDSSIATPYLGQECTGSAGGISSNGSISVQAQTSGLGSGSHGGCGTGFNSTYIKARKFAMSNISTNSTPSYKTVYFAVVTSPTTLRSDWYGNQSGNGGYYYPGAYLFTNPVSAAYQLYNYTNNTLQPPTNVTSLANSANAEFNGGVRYGMFTGVAYDLFDTQDRTIHIGQSTYPNTNSLWSAKIWFKF